ncbi:S8 family serine peptidase [Streptomyces sp. NPDC048350]|uniref:S8 family peptidase n=1 Tax=Streptomyces sp. NPDC048350 TaxID=3365538 RepID=UPI003714839E
MPEKSTVTLITGDKVTLRPTAKGRSAVTVHPAPYRDRGTSFRTLHDEGGIYVIPEDVTSLLSGTLDRELFNVRRLIDSGFDDASTKELPLIVRGSDPLAAIKGERRSRTLASIGAVAVNVPKSTSSAFTAQYTSSRKLSAEGLTKVWLDDKIRLTRTEESKPSSIGAPPPTHQSGASLDTYLERIKAPEAWSLGLSGEGVEVAVIDSGVDAKHPDLQGKVEAEANLTTDPTPGDGNGHGTHVASVAVGSGAQADGARKGVAFGANLLSAKVVTDNGEGLTSWVIAGMEWAARRGADVINVSLGGVPREDDPLADAVDALSSETDTLFVVASGDDTAGDFSVTTPGVAGSALTVAGNGYRLDGAGPAPYTYLAKPDLVAPAASIMGARAGGGTTQPYSAMTGTSPATAQTAGAAALLREQHPDWDARRVKTALTTAVQELEGQLPLNDGAGLLDVARAATDTVRLSRGNVDFAYLPYPDSSKPASRDIAITNEGDAPQTFTVSDRANDLAGDTAPDNLVTSSVEQVTVAPGTTEVVTITLTPANGDPGPYDGFVILAEKGGPRRHLPLNFTIEAPRVTTSLKVLDRHGEPWAGGTVLLVNLNGKYQPGGGGWGLVNLDEQGRGAARMAPGPMTMMATVRTPAKGDEPESVALTGHSEIMVEEDRLVTIDARRARQLEPARVEGARTEVASALIQFEQRDEKGYNLSTMLVATGDEVEDRRVFLEPTTPARHGAAAFETRWRLFSDRGTHSRQADIYDLVLGSGPTIPDELRFVVSRRQAETLARIESDYRSVLGSADTYVETVSAHSHSVNDSVALSYPLSVPQRRMEMATAREDTSWRQHVTYGTPQIFRARLVTPETVYQPGRRYSAVWFEAPAPALIATHLSDALNVGSAQISDGIHMGGVDQEILGPQPIKMFRNGKELTGAIGGSFPTTPERALFRVEHTAHPVQEIFPMGRRVDTAWTFPSEGSVPGEPVRTPSILRLDYDPETISAGVVRPGRAITMKARIIAGTDQDGVGTVEKGTLQMWVSTDHGEHWSRLSVKAGHDRWFTARAHGLQLRPGDTVSIRAHGSASGQRGIEQTLIDAYQVR